MSKVLLLLGMILASMGLLMSLTGVFDTFTQMDTDLIKPLTDNTTGYIASDNTTVPNYNAFDYIIMHNLPYVLYGAAVICIIIGLGKMGG